MTITTKTRVQNFGRFLSAMVQPNIGAFIAWGLLTALFIPTGWLPNEGLAKLVGPAITYLLPLLIGYSGGQLVAGQRGGVIAAITTTGVIVGTSIPMFLGAMIVGPASGWIIKQFDKAVEGKIKSGFEMLVNNFSIGIIGMILMLIAFKIVGPIVEILTTGLGSGVKVVVEHKLLPLVSILVEPAKILFLNNAINHGVFTPLGAQQVTEAGKSIFFMIESNPGPGMGVLLAYMLFNKGSAGKSAYGASIIHFLGGIHEIYFPYILMKPKLILAVIAGGMTGVTINMLTGNGLVGAPSPGSIIALLTFSTSGGGILLTLLSILGSCAVSFLVASPIIKFDKSEDINLEEAKEKTAAMKGKTLNAQASFNYKNIKKIVVACDAGMGSSAMGATVLRKKIQAAGLDINVTNVAIDNLQDADIVITQEALTARAKSKLPNAHHLSIGNFMDGGFYDQIIAKIKD